MELSDSKLIEASPEAVWEALLDPDVLKSCVPGCTEMTGSPEEGFEATVVQKVGPVKATFKGAVTLSELDPGQGCVITGEGKGGPAGFAKGGARVRLEPVPEGTRLHYDVEAKVGGKLAQLGSRIIDGFARKMAEQFFTCFKEKVEEPSETEGGTDAPSEGGTPTTKEGRQGWLKGRFGKAEGGAG
ncbi:CoxG family protein [Profundibacterium mesophilum]|uniref:Carbon-monoxide dehydrogenase large subunit n=1 Tax=Profundibacterium mesophilum KAUST100406-0324 TaxID=1037889 RepID=A0A921NR35_9RHOB|nr:carbon monoxide dehydrogenase subunit G [Profundibacterium mesophilum]KAF0676025.1 carbon-monoxide dehydrogenase large subunit [Profundibacterium mesophilum KAUST100406-0324]